MTHKKCSVEDCNNISHSKNYCQKHHYRFINYGDPLITKFNMNGLSRHPYYRRWSSMHERCYKEDHPAYKNYGGRGIKVCDRWHGKDGLRNFIEDMGTKENSNHSLDRIDNNGDYYPDNCRWASSTQQVINQRHTPNKTGYRGVTKTGKKFQAKIRIDGKMTALGTFNTAEEASKIFEKKWKERNEALK